MVLRFKNKYNYEIKPFEWNNMVQLTYLTLSYKTAINCVCTAMSNRMS